MNQVQKFLYSVEEAAFAISMSPRTFYNDISLVRKGKKSGYLIRPRYKGRRVFFHVDDLKAFANSLSCEPEVKRKLKVKAGIDEGGNGKEKV